MAKKEQAPTIETREHPGGGIETISRHPAYSQIGASRVSGTIRLYGSDFQHQNYICIRIYDSEMHRGLSNDWPFARREYIEVALSEAQWATMVSSLNVGHGVQCTLQHRDGQQVPRIAPPTEDPHEKFEDEARETLTRALSELDALMLEVDELKISQKQKDALKKRASMSRQQLVSNVPYVLKQFGEHMEHAVEKAKVEVNAYVTGAVMRAGLEALGGDVEAPLLELQRASKKEVNGN